MEDATAPLPRQREDAFDGADASDKQVAALATQGQFIVINSKYIDSFKIYVHAGVRTPARSVI